MCREHLEAAQRQVNNVNVSDHVVEHRFDLCVVPMSKKVSQHEPEWGQLGEAQTHLPRKANRTEQNKMSTS